MKLATTAVPALPLSSRPSLPSFMFHRLAGMVLVVGVPTLFWTSLLGVMGRALGVEIGIVRLTACGLAVGAVCLFAASAVMMRHPSDR
jgi:hypothetical protein